VDSPLSLGARGAWTSGPNAIIWSRDDADVDEEPRNVSDRGANAASRDRTAGVPARPPPPAKLYSLKRAWLMMNAAGETAVLEATKMEMQRELGVPFRDLMILDPALPTAYPSSIFIRPRAIVVNMEHVKLVVTSGLVVSPLPTLDERRGDGDDAKFARRFTRRLKRQLAAGPARACEEDLEDLTLVPMHVPPRDFSTRDDGRKGLDALDEDRETLPADDEASRTTAKMRSSEKPRASDKEKPRFANDTTDLLGLRQTPCELRVLLLPFELRVVEAALHDVSGRLLDEAVALERDAAPALETLAERVSAASLEKTRGIKAAMNSLAARVGAAREALEKLLQDDADMAAMRLSRGDDEALHEDASDDDASKAADDETGKDVRSGGTADVTEKMTREDDSLDSLAKASASASSASRSGVSVSSAGAGAEAHEGVEALLEAYYMHCDYSFKRLNELRQAVEDTEDLAEIKLDSQRNQLIKVDLMLSNGALAVGAFSMVVGVFGMNLPTGLEASRDAFVEVLFVSAVACVALFVAVVVACRRWKLLQM
jgi:magnesium transporter